MSSTVPEPTPDPGNETVSTQDTQAAEQPVITMESAVADLASRLEEKLDELSRQVSFLPPQVRNLSAKLEGVGESFSESRVKGLLNGVINLFDLVDQFLLRAGSEPLDQLDHQRHYEVLRTQMLQLLRNNGLRRIEEDGVFDPSQHNAVRREAVGEDLDGHIVKVIRPGFRTDQAVLRYSEVVVGSCERTTEEQSNETSPEADVRVEREES